MARSPKQLRLPLARTPGTCKPRPWRHKPNKALICAGCGQTFYVKQHENSRSFCGRSCWRSRAREPIADRFWRRVDKSGNCWIWTGATQSSGHGQIRIHGRGAVATHRLAWELTRGEIPEGLFVCHDCPDGDNPACCRPEHLFLGRSIDNIQDAVRKGRMGHGKGLQRSEHPRPGLACENNPRARVTREQVREIRLRYAQGGITQEQLGKEYGLSRATVGYIVNRDTWPDI